MEFDYEGHLGAVERSVSSLERDGQPARAVTLTRGCATTVEDLWDAVTNRERIPRWFIPVSGDLEPGGRYQLEGNAGGAITACEPRSRFAVTWEFGGDVSWLEVRVSDDGAGRARLTLTHTQHLSDHWDSVRSGRPRGRLGDGPPGTRDPSRAPGPAPAGRSRVRRFARRKGVHHRQQREVGAGGGRIRHGPRRRPFQGRPHDRVLHR